MNKDMNTNKGKKRLYTYDDYTLLKTKYADFKIDFDELVAITNVTNSTYNKSTRTDTIHSRVFIIRTPLRVVCIKDVFIQAILNNADPIMLMLRLHNYGVRSHTRITLSNLQHLLAVIPVLLKYPADTPDARIMHIQAEVL